MSVSNSYRIIAERTYIALSIYTAILVLRIVFAIIASALYIPSLVTATRQHLTASSDTVYAQVVVVLSILDSFGQLYSIVRQGQLRIQWLWCMTDVIMLVLWIALFGRFASILLTGNVTAYMSLDVQYGKGTMIAAMWIDLVNVLLHVLGLIFGVMVCWFGRIRSGNDNTVKVDIVERGLVYGVLLKKENEIKATFCGMHTEVALIGTSEANVPLSRLPSYSSIIREEEEGEHMVAAGDGKGVGTSKY